MDEFMKISLYLCAIENVRALRKIAWSQRTSELGQTKEALHQIVSDISGFTNCQAPYMSCLLEEMSDPDKMLYCITKLLHETYTDSPYYFIFLPEMLIIPETYYIFLRDAAKILQIPEKHP